MYHRLTLRQQLLLGGAIMACVTSPALAASDPADAVAPAAAEVAAPVDVSADAGAGLDAIVVTATKRETDLQQTPISMNVLSTQALADRHVQSVMDLADGAVPSLRVATFEARQSALTIGIRGIVPLDANQPAREQGVGIYIDGVYLGRQHGLNAGLFDIERVEVLKGPQGTLFGRNTEGGALSLVTKAPSGEFGGRIAAGFGNYGSYTGSVHLDLPEYHNIAIKVDGVIQHQDPTTSNPLPGQAGFNQYHRNGGRVAARWTPAPNFTADFAFDKSRDENTPFYSQLINYNPNNLPVATLAQIAANRNRLPAGMIAPLPSVVQVQPDRSSKGDVGVPQQPSIDKTMGFLANLKWEFAPDAELRSITAWRTVSDEQWDNSGGAHRTPAFLPGTAFSRYSLSNLDQRQFSQELQLVGKLSSIDYVLGLYYFNERANDAARTPNSNTWNADGTGYTINNIAAFSSATVARASIAYSKSYAAYGQATYTPEGMDTVHLTAGGRYTRDEKNGLLFTVNGAATNFTFDEKNNRFDPMVTLAWDATPDAHLYAKYATGYRAGGASSRSLNYRSFGPESVKSYEVGAKTEFLNNSVRLNVAAYIMDRKDSQVDFNFFVPQPDGTIRNTLETVNAEGTTKIRGVEADLTIQPVDNLTLTASYAYTYTKVPPARNTVQEQLNQQINPANTGQVFQNVFIVYTPRNAASGAIDYALPVGGGDTTLRFHLDGNYSSSAHTFDNEDVKADPSFIANGRISLADIKMSDAGQKVTVSVWARNLFNESHIYRRSDANRNQLGDYANFNAPRTYGVELAAKF